MSQPDSDTGLALALLLNQQLHQQRSTPLPAPLASRVKAWQPWIQASQDPLLQLLRHLLIQPWTWQHPRNRHMRRAFNQLSVHVGNIVIRGRRNRGGRQLSC